MYVCMYITAGNFRPGRGADGCRATAVGGAFGRAYFPVTPAPQWHLVASTAADAANRRSTPTSSTPGRPLTEIRLTCSFPFPISRHHYPFVPLNIPLSCFFLRVYISIFTLFPRLVLIWQRRELLRKFAFARLEGLFCLVSVTRLVSILWLFCVLNFCVYGRKYSYTDQFPTKLRDMVVW